LATLGGFMTLLVCLVDWSGFVVPVGFVDPFGFTLVNSTGFDVLVGFGFALEFSVGFAGVGVGMAGVGELSSLTSTFSGVGFVFISGLGVGFATPGLLMILPGSLRVPDGSFGCVVVPFCGAVGRLCFTGMGGAGNASLGSFAPG
jgi:hypothetical protein